MSEKIPTAPEQHDGTPLIESAPDRYHNKAAKEPARPERAVSDARKAVHEIIGTETESMPDKSLQAAEKPSQEPPAAMVNRELRQITLRRELKSIRRRLPAPQRVLSHVIHQPAIRAVSEVTGRTVSRPSGLLGGGLVALLGTSGYLYLARHIGFEYNYSVFLLLFAAGFVIGLCLELAVYLILSRRKSET